VRRVSSEVTFTSLYNILILLAFAIDISGKGIAKPLSHKKKLRRFFVDTL
jgi:hypothetical protein